MKEIVVDARMIEISGVGTYLQNLLSRLIDAPMRWRALLPPNVYERFSWLKKIDCIFLQTRFYSTREQWDLPRFIPKCDVFWTPSFNVPLFPIRARHRLATLHDVNQLACSSQLSIGEKMFVKTLMRRAAYGSTQVITDSLFSQREIEKHLAFPAEKMKVISLGVDHEWFNNQGKEDHLISLKYTLPKDFILFIGNVKPHKNLPRLLLAFEKTLDFRHHLVVVGRNEQALRGDDLRVFLEKRPTLKEKIHFLGFVPAEDLPPLYRLAKAFTMPSLYEGFGLPILEAMSCGCPVLAANRASLPEIAGPHAIYVNPEDVEDIARGLKEVLTKGAELTKGGVAWSRQFSWDKAAEEHLEILQSL